MLTLCLPVPLVRKKTVFTDVPSFSAPLVRKMPCFTDIPSVSVPLVRKIPCFTDRYNRFYLIFCKTKIKSIMKIGILLL